MNIGEALDKLTVNQSVITDYYQQEYAHAEFKVKGSDVLAYRDWETDRKSTRLNSSHRL